MGEGAKQTTNMDIVKMENVGNAASVNDAVTDAVTDSVNDAVKSAVNDAVKSAVNDAVNNAIDHNSIEHNHQQQQQAPLFQSVYESMNEKPTENMKQELAVLQCQPLQEHQLLQEQEQQQRQQQ